MIHLSLGRLVVDWGKNEFFNDHGQLFQSEDLKNLILRGGIVGRHEFKKKTPPTPGGGKSLSMVKLNPKLQVNSSRADSTQRVNVEGLGAVVGIIGRCCPGSFNARSRGPNDIL